MTKNYIEYYRELARNKNVTVINVVTRCLVKAYTSKQEDKIELAKVLLNKAFTPIRKPSKLASGATPYQARDHSFRLAKYYINFQKHMDEFLSEEDLVAFKEFVGKVQ